MDAVDVWLYAETSKLNAEIEAMKADNALRTANDEYPAYGEQDFLHVAEKIKEAISSSIEAKKIIAGKTSE